MYDLGAGTFDLTLDSQMVMAVIDFLSEVEVNGAAATTSTWCFITIVMRLAKQQHGRGVGSDGTVDPQFMRACRLRKENLSLRDRAEFSSILKGAIRN